MAYVKVLYGQSASVSHSSNMNYSHSSCEFRQTLLVIWIS